MKGGLWGFGSYFNRLFTQWLTGSDSVIARLPIASETKSGLLSMLQEKRNLERFSPEIHHAVIREDPEDDKFMDCAREAKADCIISGDTHLLRINAYQTIPILSPKDFLNMIKS